ncbi:rhodanese-like domain-containing protein [Anaerosporobacter sp.]|uniref:rhodanese-like domain-containing protein n=1 Tax=Anaerosporobacter sp. TaxID=1872529 RepID=UPI00286EBF77|nr:rhodanese-like domain-containing protein [Anaerosporobacter sp.]
MYMQKIRLELMGVIVILLMLTACATSTPSGQEWSVLQDISFDPAFEQVLPEYIKITSEEAQDMMSENVIILDVRTQEEYDEGYIENAILLSENEIQESAKTVIADKNGRNETKWRKTERQYVCIILH